MAEDVRLEMIERRITALGYGTPAYHEAMGWYLTVMARRQFALADQAKITKEKST